METVKIDEVLNHPVEDVWAIFADVTRCDWVPAVDVISLRDDVRYFHMEGVGEVAERILLLDHDRHCLQYSAIESPAPLEHHLATIQLSAAERGCHLLWTTEIAPDQFLPAIENGMTLSFEGLKKVLGEGSR
ncbi:unnamed protein product [Scytosiphon promiscuus]